MPGNQIKKRSTKQFRGDSAIERAGQGNFFWGGGGIRQSIHRSFEHEWLIRCVLYVQLHWVCECRQQESVIHILHSRRL
jgi:hypothetical protein